MKLSELSPATLEKLKSCVENPQDEFFLAGYMAVCEQVPGEGFYAAILYHEWFIVDNPKIPS